MSTFLTSTKRCRLIFLLLCVSLLQVWLSLSRLDDPEKIRIFKVFKHVRPQEPHTPESRTLELRYNRKLCAGLGDRLSVYLNVAAMAEALNATCYVFWCEDNPGTPNFYRLQDVVKYVTLPSRLVVLSEGEFLRYTSRMDEIHFEHGDLPALNAYDGAYTLAYRTMVLPQWMRRNVTEDEFVSAYRRVCQNWTVHPDREVVRGAYIALHIQESDKVSNDEARYVPRHQKQCNRSSSALQLFRDKYCTWEVLEWLESIDLRVILISEGNRVKRQLLSDYGHIMTVSNDRKLTKLAREVRDIALMIQAVGIIQHAAIGWSSLSSMVAMAKQVPLFNTWKGNYNILSFFDAVGRRPNELANCDHNLISQSISNFAAEVLLRAAAAAAVQSPEGSITTDHAVASHPSPGDAPGGSASALRGAVFRYNRKLCSGLGSRFAVFLNVAAMAEVLNATCYVFWCEDNPDSDRFYSWKEVAEYMTMPSSLVMLSEAEFLDRTAGMEDIQYENGILPAMFGYDGVYTLADKTMVLPQQYHGVRPFTELEFVAAYRRVGSEWKVRMDLDEFARPFIVLHIRESDTLQMHGLRGYVPQYEIDCKRESGHGVFKGKKAAKSCTRDVIRALGGFDVPVILISEDTDAKRRVLADFGHVLSVPNCRSSSKLAIEIRDMGLMMQAAGIVQHAPSAWSSFSAVVAMAKGIPLLSTWPEPSNLLDYFPASGGVPKELISCNLKNKLQSTTVFWSEVRAQMIMEERRQALTQAQPPDRTYLASRAKTGLALRYNRKLCGGLGSRFAVFLNVAAMAEVLNATCYVFWCEDNPGTDRFYEWKEVTEYMTMPSSLVMLSEAEFLDRTAGMEDIQYENGILPAMFGYDGVYTLADKTMVLPQRFQQSFTESEFVSAYRRVCMEWSVKVDLEDFPRPFAVLHLRESDTLHLHSLKGYTPEYEMECNRLLNSSQPNQQNYHTKEVLGAVTDSHIPILLISEDDDAKRRVLADFGHVLTVPNCRNFSKLELEMRDMGLMMRSVGIIQHAASAWSAFSSVVAMSMEVPLLNTWQGTTSLLDYFDGAGTIPKELMGCSSDRTLNSITAFWSEALARATDYDRHASPPHSSKSLNFKLKTEIGDIAPRNDLKLRYNRKLCTGLGDRVSVYLNVAAMAEVLNATCYVFWCEDNPGTDRFYRWKEVAEYMTMPSSLVMLSEEEFTHRTTGVDDIHFENGTLPAAHGFDGVYTLAHKTMVLPREINRSISDDEFVSAYRRVCRQWRINVDFPGFRRPYIALHIRESDKVYRENEKGYRPKHQIECDSRLQKELPEDANHYCTRETLDFLQTWNIPVVLISEDERAKRKVLADFGHILSVPNNKRQSKLALEMRDMALMMRAAGIVQHSPLAWSSYSSVVAMAREVPLLSTWQGPQSMTEYFEWQGGRPWELTACGTDLDKTFSDFHRNVLARAARTYGDELM